MAPSRTSSATPSAWDDDWENIADKQESLPEPTTAPEPRLSRAERKAQHQASNRKLWEEASTVNETPIFIQARNPDPPLVHQPISSGFKVLARRPPPATKITPSTSTADNAQVPVEDEIDSDEEERRKAASEFADRQAKAAKEREEKQRKYAEVRERLFGTEGGSATAKGGNTARSGSNSRPSSSGGAVNTRGNGRGRGFVQIRSGTSSPARNTRESQKLYEPEYAAKPGSVFIQRREAGSPAPSNVQKPIREPRGPDGTSRGFALRSNETTAG